MEKCTNNLYIGELVDNDKKCTKNAVQKDLHGDEFFESYLKAIGRDKNEILNKNEVDNAVERLAASFGIGSTFMNAILTSLHIKPEDLLDESKQKMIVKKLEMYFGVTKKKEEALDELISIKNRRVE